MTPATATLHARQTFGSVGYHQIHTLESIKQLIDTGIAYSALTSTGFKHITKIEPKGKENAYKLVLSLLGKRVEVTVAQSQTFWDFNQAMQVPLLELLPSQSGILFNTSTDLRCNGVNIKLQVAEVIDIERLSREVEVYDLQLSSLNPKVYIDNLECGV